MFGLLVSPLVSRLSRFGSTPADQPPQVLNAMSRQLRRLCGGDPLGHIGVGLLVTHIFLKNLGLGHRDALLPTASKVLAQGFLCTSLSRL
jgi:hypothetical protein